MKFPNFNMNKSFTARALVLLAGLLLLTGSVLAQTKIDAPQASNNVEQCRNGTAASPKQCIDGQWQNGNAGSSNSHWAETQFIAYRAVIAGLTPGTEYTYDLGYDILKGTVHAIDYLGTYNATATDADPCHDVGCNLSVPTSTIGIPTDTDTVTNKINPYTNSPIIQQPGVLTMWGGTLTAIAYNPYDGTEHRSLHITFTAGSSTVVFAFGGHIAWGGDWGVGNSAGGISGSPYHTNYDACSFSCVTHENSMSADAVIPSGVLNIVKVVNDTPAGGITTGTALTSFSFTASSGFTPLTFSLIDNVVGPGGVTKQSDPILAFGAANAITVTEADTAGWQLTDVSCTTNVASSASTSIANKNVVVTSNAGALTTCTFTNGQLAVTAAPVTVGGRITTALGTGISGVSVGLTDLTTGKTRYTLTNSFGYYTFSNCMTEDFYFVGIESKRYRFPSYQKTFTLRDNLLDLDFVANP